MSANEKKSGISRRNFIKGFGGGIVGTAAVGSAISSHASAQSGPANSVIRGPDKIPITLTINGKKYDLKFEPRVTLLDAIRDHIGLTGSKRVCNRGECGACTVILNGKTVYACSMFAIDADGGVIETIEGLAKEDQLHPLQESFVKQDAIQCGFCTSGFIVSSAALLNANPSPSLDQIKEGVAGHVCRCGSYPHIFDAVDEAVKNMRKGG